VTVLEKLLPRDIIAIIAIIGGLVLLSTGIDSTVGAILMAVVSFYFGAEALERRKRE